MTSLDPGSEPVRRARPASKARPTLLPICSYCKKVRNDGNDWEQMETSVSERSDPQLSHGICPACRDGVVKDQLESWRGRP